MDPDRDTCNPPSGKEVKTAPVFRQALFFSKKQNESFVQLALLTHLGEALAAIDRTVLTGSERNLGFLTTSSAGSSEHFTLRLCGVLTGITAGFASLGLVYETLGSIKFLLAGGEYKFSATFFADESLVFVHLIYLALDNKIFRPLTDLNRRL